MNRPTLNRLWKFLRNAMVAVCGMAIVVALLPSKARSQLGLDPCCAIMSAGLNSISGLLRNVVAQPLGSIQQNQQQSAQSGVQHSSYPARVAKKPYHHLGTRRARL